MRRRVIFPNRVLPYLLVAPQLAITIVFFFWPAAQAIYQSVLIQDPFGLHTEFVWLENFRTILTDPEVFRVATEFGREIGKVPVQTSDRTGFIVNRLLVPYMLDSIRALEEGVASIVDIDNAMKLGCGYPMGPLTLGDFVGLDTTFYIANIMFDEFKEKRFAPPPLLKRMVMAGLYGRKCGRGFYDYSDPTNPCPMNLL